MNLKEEIGGIIYDADIYKAKVTTGQLNNIVDEITKAIENRIDSFPTPNFNNGIYTKESLEQVTKWMKDAFKELLK